MIQIVLVKAGNQLQSFAVQQVCQVMAYRMSGQGPHISHFLAATISSDQKLQRFDDAADLDVFGNAPEKLAHAGDALIGRPFTESHIGNCAGA